MFFGIRAQVYALDSLQTDKNWHENDLKFLKYQYFCASGFPTVNPNIPKNCPFLSKTYPKLRKYSKSRPKTTFFGIRAKFHVLDDPQSNKNYFKTIKRTTLCLIFRKLHKFQFNRDFKANFGYGGMLPPGVEPKLPKLDE